MNEDWCSICGRRFSYPNHRCPAKTLSAIDAADTRMANAQLRGDDYLGHPANHRSFARRLSEGSRLLELER